MVKFKLSKQTLTALWGNFLERCRFCNELISHSHQSHLQPHFVNTCKLRYSLLALNQVHSSSKHCDLLLQIKNPGYSRYFHSLIFNRILHLIYPTLLALGCKLGCEGVVKLFGHFFMLSLHFFVWALTAWNFYRLFFWFTTDKEVCSCLFIFETHY